MTASAPPLPVGAAVPEALHALRERKRILDAAFVGLFLAVFVAIGVAWFLRILAIDFAALAWATLVSAVLYTSGAMLADRARSSRTLLVATHVLQGLGVVALGMLWHLAGGIGNPMFLLAFVLPVIAAGVLVVRSQHVVAIGSVVVVWLVALAESADLRWYVARLGLPGDGRALEALRFLPARPDPFPGYDTAPGFGFVVLVLFSIFTMTAALVSDSVTGLLARLYTRLRTSDEMLAEVRSLFESALRVDPTPSVIVYADTGQLVHVSDSFLQQMLLAPEDLPGRTIFDLVRLANPDELRAALGQREEEIPHCVYGIGEETRIASLRVFRIDHGGAAYAYLGFSDLTELYYLSAVFDGINDALMVVSADGRLLYANQGASDLFPGVHFGMDVRPLLSAPDEEEDWWRAEERGEIERRLRLDGQPFRATITAAPLPGQGTLATILTLRSVAEEERLYQMAVRDALTGLYNRRYFAEALPAAVARGDRGVSCALGLLDMDYFKQVNDEMGHPAGDAALRHFTSVVRRRLRVTDVFARLGGDEFAIIFADAGAGEAFAVMERVYEDLRSQPLVFEGSPPRKLGFSCGVAALHAGDSVETVSARADEALYAAKQAGRGRCVARD
jgi:diguanylate cyclase (GGDEF)-like protein